MVAVTYAEVISHLVGLDAWLEAAARSVARFDQANIERRIPGWVRRFERECQIRINPVQVVAAPDGTYNTPDIGAGTVTSAGTKITGAGTTFTGFFMPGQILTVSGVSMPILSIESDAALTLIEPPPVPWTGAAYGRFVRPIVVADGYPYFKDDAGEFMMTTLRERPVQQVQRMRFLLNGRTSIITFPAEWYSFEKSGRFWIVPIFASAAITGLAAALSIMGAMISDYMPNALFFDYVAGLPDNWQDTSEWADVRHALECWCALQILNHVGQAFGAGVSSKSVNTAVGSQSFNYTRFTDRKKELQQTVDDFKATFAAQQTPFMLDYV